MSEAQAGNRGWTALAGSSPASGVSAVRMPPWAAVLVRAVRGGPEKGKTADARRLRRDLELLGSTLGPRLARDIGLADHPDCPERE